MDDQIDQELLKRSKSSDVIHSNREALDLVSGTNTGNDKTSISGILKGNGSTVSAATANTDYVPAIAGTNYLKVDNTGISSKGDMNLFSPNGLNSFQLSNVVWSLILTDNTDFVQFYADAVGSFGATATQGIFFQVGTNYIVIAGASSVSCDALTGFSAYDETGSNTITLTALGMDVTAPLIRLNDKIAFTPDGGYCVKLTNKTGAVTVKGHVVTVYNATAINNAVAKTIVDVPNAIGVFYESGIADGQEAWIVTSGIADVYFGSSTTRGHLARTTITGDAFTTAGYALSEAVPSAPFATDKHFCELGHVLESRTGAGLAKVNVHLN